MCSTGRNTANEVGKTELAMDFSFRQASAFGLLGFATVHRLRSVPHGIDV